MDIQWGSFLVVAVVVLIVTVALTAFFAGGVRLLAAEGTTNAAARAGAYVCFAVCVAVVLFSLWLIIPQFHSS